MEAHAESTRSESTPAGPNEFTYFYLWDQVGSVRVVANGQGVTVETHDYEPYGLEMSSAMCPSSSLMRYAGQERDYLTSDCSDTVDYMHYRFYASTMGRFMRPDDVSGNPMNPQTWNLYSYVHGNPVNFNDPTGHYAPYGVDRTEIHITLWRQNPVDFEGADNWASGGEGGGVINGGGDSQTSANSGRGSTTFGGQDYSLTVNPPNNGQPLPANGSTQTLSALPVPAPRPNVSAIRWELSQKSKSGGYIVQEIYVLDASRLLQSHYWEAWRVIEGTQHTKYFPQYPYDDTFQDPTGWVVHASARFYEGLVLPSSFQVGAAGTHAASLPATAIDPQLPTADATAPVIRTWTAP